MVLSLRILIFLGRGVDTGSGFLKTNLQVKETFWGGEESSFQNLYLPFHMHNPSDKHKISYLIHLYLTILLQIYEVRPMSTTLFFNE